MEIRETSRRVGGPGLASSPHLQSASPRAVPWDPRGTCCVACVGGRGGPQAPYGLSVSLGL